MRLKLLLPTEVLVDTEVSKVVAEAENGSFCLLPRHVDFVAVLVPSIFYYTDHNHKEYLYAIDHGSLVKCGEQVSVSTMNAIQGDDLHSLERTIEERFIDLDEHERAARTALGRLEAGTVRRFMELQEQRRG
ncbi:ATP synthase F0F1 subunit epsilon [Candidatus Tenderia electrophaga]|jgi:F-type H+-transporting ATPase subunit epsilon|uniref:ATP synthase epsilon chain n=1 Tax=Candidatus Tenderia electrophaga TaxID=1748243 RepID=A0A0S2TFF4_9GAMM|nr:ATP synthase F0F1 subunit epsilon [Candidatus Tenderia electrophaga]